MQPVEQVDLGQAYQKRTIEFVPHLKNGRKLSVSERAQAWFWVGQIDSGKSGVVL